MQTATLNMDIDLAIKLGLITHLSNSEELVFIEALLDISEMCPEYEGKTFLEILKDDGGYIRVKQDVKPDFIPSIKKIYLGFYTSNDAHIFVVSVAQMQDEEYVVLTEPHRHQANISKDLSWDNLAFYDLLYQRDAGVFMKILFTQINQDLPYAPELSWVSGKIKGNIIDSARKLMEPKAFAKLLIQAKADPKLYDEVKAIENELNVSLLKNSNRHMQTYLNKINESLQFIKANGNKPELSDRWEDNIKVIEDALTEMGFGQHDFSSNN